MSRIILSDDEKQAIREAVSVLGRCWKTRLGTIWATGKYSTYGLDLFAGALQSLRNRIGPSGLANLHPEDWSEKFVLSISTWNCPRCIAPLVEVHFTNDEKPESPCHRCGTPLSLHHTTHRKNFSKSLLSELKKMDA